VGNVFFNGKIRIENKSRGNGGDGAGVLSIGGEGTGAVAATSEPAGTAGTLAEGAEEVAGSGSVAAVAAEAATGQVAVAAGAGGGGGGGGVRLVSGVATVKRTVPASFMGADVGGILAEYIVVGTFTASKR